MTKTRSYFLLFLILFLGTVLRLWGLGFGLPELNHADEPIVVNHALAYGLGDLNPHFFNIPPLTGYLLFIIYGLYFLAGHILGSFPGKQAFLDLFLSDPSSFYYLGRLFIGVLFGLMAIYAFYRLGRRLWGRAISLFGALVMAVIYLPVQVSHFIYPDSPLLFAIILSLYFYVRIYQKGRPQDYLYALLATGFAVGLKYNAALLVIPYLTAHFLRVWEKGELRDIKPLIGLPLVSAVLLAFLFFLLNPFFVLDSQFALTELANQSGSTGFQGWGHHLFYSLNAGLGLPLLLVFLVSLVTSLFSLRRARYLLIFYSATVVFYLHLVLFAQPYSRYGILLIPEAVFFSVFFLEKVFQSLDKKVFVVLVAAALLFIPLTEDIRLGMLLKEADTRNLAKTWILKYIPSGAKIFLDNSRFEPKLPFCREYLEDIQGRLGPHSAQAARIKALLAVQKTSPCFTVYFPASNDEKKAASFSLQGRQLPFEWESLRKEGIRYLGLTRLGVNDPDEATTAYLKDHGRLLASFSPYRNPDQFYSFDPIDLTGAPTTFDDLRSRVRNGHLIEIYELDWA